MLKIIMSINLGNRNCKQFSKITQFYTFNEGFKKNCNIHTLTAL